MIGSQELRSAWQLQKWKRTLPAKRTSASLFLTRSAFFSRIAQLSYVFKSHSTIVIFMITQNSDHFVVNIRDVSCLVMPTSHSLSASETRIYSSPSLANDEYGRKYGRKKGTYSGPPGGTDVRVGTGGLAVGAGGGLTGGLEVGTGGLTGGLPVTVGLGPGGLTGGLLVGLGLTGGLAVGWGLTGGLG